MALVQFWKCRKCFHFYEVKNKVYCLYVEWKDTLNCNSNCFSYWLHGWGIRRGQLLFFTKEYPDGFNVVHLTFCSISQLHKQAVFTPRVDTSSAPPVGPCSAVWGPDFLSGWPVQSWPFPLKTENLFLQNRPGFHSLWKPDKPWIPLKSLPRTFLNQEPLAAEYVGDLKFQRRVCHIWATLSYRKCQDLMAYALRESENLSLHFPEKGRDHWTIGNHIIFKINHIKSAKVTV